MGYVSEVCIGVPKQHADAIRDFELFDEEFNYDQDMVMFYNSWLKWYDHNPEVLYIERLITDLIEQDKEAFLFRLGEEPGDISEIGEPYNYDIYMNQSISKPF